MRALAAVVVLGLALTSTAEAQVAKVPQEWDAWGRPLDPIGWTADSRFFVFKRRVEYWPLETIEDDDAKALSYQFGVIREPRSGREKRYTLELTLDGLPASRPELDNAPRMADFAAWLKESPVLLEAGFTTSRGGTIIVEAEQGGQKVDVPVVNGRARFDLPGKKALKVSISVDSDGRRYLLRELREQKGPLAGTISTFVSPDGLRVALYLRLATDQGQGPTDYLTISPIGPRVDVIVGAPQAKQAGHAYAHLEHAGFAPIALHYGERTPAGTLIEVAAGFEVEAQRLADGLHGQVEVEPMTKPSKYDIAVVAGAELLLPVPMADDLFDVSSRPNQDGVVRRRGSTRFGAAVALAAVAVLIAALVVLRRR